MPLQRTLVLENPRREARSVIALSGLSLASDADSSCFKRVESPEIRVALWPLRLATARSDSKVELPSLVHGSRRFPSGILYALSRQGFLFQLDQGSRPLPVADG
jgi:hypothetical protein